LKTRISPPNSRRNGLATRLNGNSSADGSLEPGLDTESLLTPPRSLLGNKFPESNRRRLKVVILGPALSTASDETAVAVYSGLLREFGARGHDALFLERQTTAPFSDGELPKPSPARIETYSSVKELKDRFAATVREADFVIVGSGIGDGLEIGEWVTRNAQGATAFYDLDLPRTMGNLLKGNLDGISAALISRYDLYLSSTGGPLLNYLETHYGSPMARPLYCSVDAMLYFPEERPIKWDLGYLGTYDPEHQSALDRLLLQAARRWGEGQFVVAGTNYPRSIRWPANVKRSPQVQPRKHREFYNSQRFTLNMNPSKVAATGFSPSAQLFEAAACGTPIITEFWPGLDGFFAPDKEILISHSADETLIYLEEISELERRRIGYRARERVLARHTTRHRAAELEKYALGVLKLSSV